MTPSDSTRTCQLSKQVSLATKQKKEHQSVLQKAQVADDKALEQWQTNHSLKQRKKAFYPFHFASTSSAGDVMVLPH
ncbi:hypothetical protein TNIN_100091 [Trichonephila inaurata madagascariensis]|uniref:Uncharacterized protein n=1 Tax=Trichonephila inaurata madagascariensis TaxID=2747483 RepID=A0A8X7CSH3_9ARAC|nr:hypothetical protein TNIN_100091 [Trichonephila inaurata madagascariensis]